MPTLSWAVSAEVLPLNTSSATSSAVQPNEWCRTLQPRWPSRLLPCMVQRAAVIKLSCSSLGAFQGAGKQPATDTICSDCAHNVNVPDICHMVSIPAHSDAACAMQTLMRLWLQDSERPHSTPPLWQECRQQRQRLAERLAAQPPQVPARQ